LTPGSLGGVWLNYIRGQIYLRGKSGKEAAVEFQKLIDHRGLEPLLAVVFAGAFGIGASFGFGRRYRNGAQGISGFSGALENADQDLPILIEAKKEYEQVK